MQCFFFFFSEEGVEGCCRMGGNSLLSSQKESKTNCKKMFKWICTLMREARGGEGEEEKKKKKNPRTSCPTADVFRMGFGSFYSERWVYFGR